MSRILSDKEVQRKFVDLLEQILIELKIQNLYLQSIVGEDLSDINRTR